jgi:predicted Zn finger-like uncharacterized protein
VIVTCEQCSTQFRLDDARVPERGARVRCSRCKHSFFVKPETPAGDAVESAVERALSQEAEPRDAVESAAERALGPEARPRDAGETAPDLPDLDDAGDTGEESDWEFNHEAEAASDAPDVARADAAQEAVDDLLGRSTPARAAPSSGLESLLDSDPDLEQDLAEDSAAVDVSADLEVSASAEVHAASSASSDSIGDGPVEDMFGAAGSFEGLEDPSQIDESAADDSPWDDSGLDLSAETQAEAPPAPDRLEAAQSDPLGTPDDWDFFDHEAAGATTQEPEAGAAAPSDALLLGPSRLPLGAAAEPSPLQRLMGRAAHAVGWALSAALVLVALHGSLLAPNSGPRVSGPLRPLPELEAVDVQGRWVENAVSGPIFVVSGRLRSAGGGRVVPGAWLAVRLIDPGGALIADRAGALGPALPTARLREENPRDLRAMQASGALAMAWSAIDPGDELPLQAILSDLPDGAQRFDWVAIPAQEAAPIPEGLGSRRPDAG